ncbi:MAG: bifunctional 2-polyprenyl-6-hydroxyphenol methylase/3-demethylubiquinol 3-O-methyltransferase UbiG [Gammaproteobacteria bacterium]
MMKLNSKVNLNPNEVGKFDALAHQWWDPHGPFKPLHQLNPLRTAFITSGQSLERQRILDVGCGGGLLTEALAPHCLQITGIDAAQQAIEVSKSHAAAYGLNIEYLQKTAEALASERPNAYDIVCCMELIEHVPSPLQLLESLSTLVKPGGLVYISTLNRTLKSYLTAILGAEYILKLLPKGTHDYQTFIRPSELIKLARSAQLELEALQGIQYHLLKQSFELSKDVSVNYLTRFRCEK